MTAAVTAALAAGLALAVGDGGVVDRVDQRVVTAGNRWVAPRDEAVTVLEAMSFFGERVPLVVLVGLAAGLLWAPGRGRRVAFLLLSTLTAWWVVSVSKGLVDRPRPEVNDAVARGVATSYPSGHALVATVVFGGLLLAWWPVLAARLRRPAVVATVVVVAAVGASRVLLGVHFPTDVLGGYLVGLGWLALWSTILGIGPAARTGRPRRSDGDGPERDDGAVMSPRTPSSPERRGSTRWRGRTLVALAVALVVAVAAPVVAPAAAQENADDGPDERRPGRVLVVSIPRLTWDQVVEARPENLVAFFDEAAVGNLSLRTIGPRTSLGAAYVTIGAGNRAGVTGADAGRVMPVSDRFENGSAGDAFLRRTGEVTEAEIIHLAIPSVQAQNRRYLYGAEPGSLGSALVGAGITPVVVANTDVQAAPDAEVATDPLFPTGEPEDAVGAEAPIVGASTGAALAEPVQSENRPAGLAVMTTEGEIARGEVDRSLLIRDRTAPFGVRLWPDRVVGATEEFWQDDTLALVELSDVERADWYRNRVDGAQARELTAEALTRTDELFGRVVDLAGPDDLVIVVSPAAPRRGETLTPLAVRGPGFESGVLTSGTTRRDGYVTLPDIAPTILGALDVEEPASMSGSPFTASNDGDTSAGRFERFVELNDATAFRDDKIGSITVALVVLQVVLSALALVALQRDLAWTRRAARGLALFTMSVPVVSFLLGLVPFHDIGFWPYVLALVSASSAMAVASLVFGTRVVRRRPDVAVTAIPVLATFVVLAVDITTGARLQVNTLFGYSPVVAGRFAGFGNPALSLFSMSTVLIACGAWAIFDGDRRRRLIAGVIAFFALAVLLIGHPSIGPNVGGVLSLVPAAFVVVSLLLGRRLRFRVVAAGVGATLVAIGAFAAFDLSRPVAEQSHLGRLVRTIGGDGGTDDFLVILERKINANLHILTTSAWTWTIPLALLLLLRVTWRRPKFLDERLDRRPATNAVLWGGIALCVFAMAVNDSGIAIPAVMFTLFLPAIICLALTTPDPSTPGAVDGEVATGVLDGRPARPTED